MAAACSKTAIRPANLACSRSRLKAETRDSQSRHSQDFFPQLSRSRLMKPRPLEYTDPGFTRSPNGNNPPIIVVQGLRRSYGKIEAVRGVSFSIPKGCVWGLLGPNGAGKTSIIEMIEGLRRPDSGTITVQGLDPF